MLKLLIIFFPLIIGCAYVSHTTATLKATDAKVVKYGAGKGDILFDRTMCLGFGCKQTEKEVNQNDKK